MTSYDSISTRRGFLKTAAGASAAMAGGLTATAAWSETQPESTARAGPCGFSELPRDFVYLNSGTEGSMPACVISTFQQGLKQWAGNPTMSYELDPVLGKRQEMNREKAARFLGVGKNNVCLTDNTTMGLSMTLMGLNFRPGDRVVISNHEHNAIKSPLAILQQRQGLEIETRPFPGSRALNAMDSSDLLDALFPNTSALRGAKALCVSHVYPTSGVRLPLRALREKADQLEIPYLVVDGAQAMGMVDLTADGDSLQNCDFYACPGHKWLNGPPGTGILYLRNAELRPPEFYPTISQRMGKYDDCGDNARDCFPIAEALQVRGCSNAPGFAAMIRAMKFAQDAGGPAQIEKHILGLSREIKAFILSRAPRCLISPHSDPGLQSGITAFFPFRWDKPEEPLKDKKTAEFVVSEMLKRNVRVRFIGFADSGSASQATEDSYAIRVSTGYFNSLEHVQIFKRVLQEVLSRIS